MAAAQPQGMSVFQAAGAQLGECALWCDRAQALWWTDIDAGRLWRSPPGGTARHWQLPQKLGSFALCEQPGRLLLGLSDGLALFDTDRDHLGPLSLVEADEPATRINDGRCDRQGRFVFGMFNQKGPQALGHFWRVGPDLRPERLPLPPATVANSLCFSPDGQRLYFTDSPTRQLWQVDYHADGRLGRPQLFARFAADDGEPDGATVDQAGCVWVALWGAASVAVLSPGGKELRRLPVGAPHPTCPVFGGPQLRDLYLTSARCALDAQALQQWPAAGDVFQCQGIGQGLAPWRFQCGD